MDMENQDQSDELYPIAVLIDELKVRFPCAAVPALGEGHRLNAPYP